MKYFLRYLTLVLFLFSSLFFQFCTKCGKKAVQKQAIENYIYNQVFKLDSKNQMNFFPADSIPMSVDDTVYILLHAKIRVVDNYKAGNGNLYACDPVFPQTQALGDSIRIEVMDDFDATHPAGSNVTDLFLFYDQNFFDGGVMVGRHLPISHFKQFSQTENGLNLALVKKPTFQNIRFKIYVYKQTYADGANTVTPVLRFF